MMLTRVSVGVPEGHRLSINVVFCSAATGVDDFSGDDRRRLSLGAWGGSLWSANERPGEGVGGQEA